MYTTLSKVKVVLITIGLALFVNPAFAEEEESDPAEIAIGERLIPASVKRGL